MLEYWTGRLQAFGVRRRAHDEEHFLPCALCLKSDLLKAHGYLEKYSSIASHMASATADITLGFLSSFSSVEWLR